MDNPVFVTIRKAVAITGLSSYAIRAGVNNGEIPHIWSGNRIMINLPLYLQQLDAKSMTGRM